MDQQLLLVVAGAVTLGAIAYFFMGGSSAPKQPFLDKSRQSLVISDIVQLSHDTKRFRLALPHPKMKLGLPIGKHFKLYCPNVEGKVAGEWNGRTDSETGKEIERKYTPTTLDEDLGHVDLVIKVYKGGVLDRFPDGGKMSQFLDSKKVGDNLELSGPWGMLEYVGNGGLKKGSKVYTAKHYGMMAGGTGITPMLQLIAAILREDNDVDVSLLYANQSEDDILVRDLLEKYQADFPKRFKLWYTVDRPKDGWKYSSGFITADMIRDHLPAPGPDTLVAMCGPPPMIEYACKKNLDDLGYSKESQFAW